MDFFSKKNIEIVTFLTFEASARRERNGKIHKFQYMQIKSKQFPCTFYVYFLLYDFNLTISLLREILDVWQFSTNIHSDVNVDIKAWDFIDFNGIAIKHKILRENSSDKSQAREVQNLWAFYLKTLLFEWMQNAHIINYNTLTTSSGNWRSSSGELFYTQNKLDFWKLSCCAHSQQQAWNNSEDWLAKEREIESKAQDEERKIKWQPSSELCKVK